MSKRRARWLTFWIVLFALPVLALFLMRGGRVAPPEPFPIPTSASVPTGDQVVLAEMRPVGPCLFLFDGDGSTRGPSILPIWPDGFSAKQGPRVFVLYSAPNQEIPAVAMSELMELHGQYIEIAPADARIPLDCTKHPLFLVGQVINRS